MDTDIVTLLVGARAVELTSLEAHRLAALLSRAEGAAPLTAGLIVPGAHQVELGDTELRLVHSVLGRRTAELFGGLADLNDSVRDELGHAA